MMGEVPYTSWGGGHGDPLKGPVALVLERFLNDMISCKYAARIYGVVIKDNSVDEDATTKLRKKMATSPRDKD